MKTTLHSQFLPPSASRSPAAAGLNRMGNTPMDLTPTTMPQLPSYPLNPAILMSMPTAQPTTITRPVRRRTLMVPATTRTTMTRSHYRPRRSAI